MRKLKHLSLVLLSVATFVFASGCDLMGANSSSAQDILQNKVASKTGFYAEQFIPEDSSFVIGFDYQDPSQDEAFDKLRKEFATDSQWKALLAELYAEFDLNEFGMDFEEDLLGIVGDNPRIVLVADKKAFEYVLNPQYLYPGDEGYPYEPMTSEEMEEAGATVTEKDGVTVRSLIKEMPDGEISSTAADEVTDSLYGLPYQKPFDGNWYILIRLDDVEKFNKLMELFVDEEEFLEVEGAEMQMWFDDEETFVARHQDILVASNTKANVEDAIDRAKKGKDSIKDNEQFQKTFENIEYPHFAYMYFDVQDYADVYKEFTTATEPELGDFVEGIYDKFVKGEASALSLSLEDKGLRMKSYAYIDEETLDQDDKGFEVFGGGDLHLLDKVPGEGMLIYEELSSGVADIVKEFMSGIEDGLKGIGEVGEIDFKAQFRAITGLDLEKDLLSFMDKNFAFYLSNSGGIIPNFGIWFDASSNTDAAKRTIDVLDSTITVGIMGLKSSMTPEQSQIIVKDTVNLNGRDVHRLSLDFSSLSEQDLALFDVEKIFTSNKFEFYYGLTGDDVFMLSFHSDLAKKYGKLTLAKELSYKEAVDNLGISANQSVVFLDVSAFLDYFEGMMATYEKIEGDAFFSEYEKEEYTEIKKYLDPIGTLLMLGEASRTEQIAEGFFRIGK